MVRLFRAYRALGPVDARNVQRDDMLRWVGLAPLLLAAVIRFGVPPLADWMLRQWQFDLRPYYGLLISFLYLFLPMMVGMVLGFLLLDQRDDHTLTAIQVTPLSLNGYLAYRITLPALLALVGSLVMIPLAGLIPLRLDAHLAASLGSALIAPLFALFIATAAQNKVQGMAVMKAASVINLPPLLAFFVQGPAQWAFGLVPTYWPVKVFWLLQASDPWGWAALTAGLAYQALLLAWMVKQYNAVMRRGG